MRTISFVDRLELELFSLPSSSSQPQQYPSICQQAIALGDVDNDGKNELIVGTVSGQLLIFKGSEPLPWKTCKDLGMITCVTIGDVCNRGSNFGLILSADGWCHLFYLPAGQESQSSVEENPDLPFTHRQHLSANGKLVMVADIDGDKKLEICIASSDRVVRTYRWCAHHDCKTGEIVALNKWSLMAQIGSISLKFEDEMIPELIVSQPGANYAILKLNGQLVYKQTTASKVMSQTVYTEIIGNVNTNNALQYYALATLDGTIMLMDNHGEKIYDIKVDHQLFGLTKLDITGNETEEILVCSWDGQTYIINSNKQIARFQFDEPTAAFIAGHYSVGNDKNETCLIYVTFDGRIYIYYNIKLSHVQTFTLTEALDNSQRVTDFMKKVGMNECSIEDKKKLVQWCLYGRKPKNI